MSSVWSRRLLLFAALTLLVIQLTVQLSLARTDAQTTDEGVHLAAGYTYLTRRDYRFNPEHPPLVKTLAALPLLVIQPNPPKDDQYLWSKSAGFFFDSFAENRYWAEQWLYGSGNNPDQLIFWGRLPMVILTFLLGLSVWLMVRRHWGDWAALLAVALFAFEPTINAHGHLITTDIGLSLASLWTVYCFYRHLSEGKWKWLTLSALAFGLALLSKHTAIILVPIGLVLLALRFAKKLTALRPKQFICQMAVALVIVFSVIWLGFGFHDRLMPRVDSYYAEYYLVRPDSQAKLAQVSNDATVTKVYNAVTYLGLPGDYVKGLIFTTTHAAGGHSSYLLGQISNQGWWYYFPVVLLTKASTLLLVIFLVSLVVLVKQRQTDSLTGSIGIAAVIFLVVAMGSKANLGVRHVLPVMVMGIIFCSAALSKTLQATQAKQLLLVAVALLAIGYYRSYPDYLNYYNIYAGGSPNGYRIATDSNTDWGQDLKRLAKYLQTNYPNQPYYIDYAWAGDSAVSYYIPSARRLIDYSGGAGWAVTGSTGYNQPSNSWLVNCPGLERPTPSLFICPLPLSR